MSKIQENAIFLLFDLVNFGTFCQIREVFRGSCETALPGKIDDFEATYKWQQSCHAPFDEAAKTFQRSGGPLKSKAGEATLVANRRDRPRRMGGNGLNRAILQGK